MASVSPFRSVALAARLRQGQALPTLIAELKAAASTSSLTSLATAGQSSTVHRSRSDNVGAIGHTKGLKLTNPLQALALACAQDMAAIESGRLTLKDLRLNDVKIPDHVSVGEYCVASKVSTNSPFAISPQSAVSGDHQCHDGGASNQQHQQQHDQDEADAEHAALLSLLDTFLWREAFATDRTLSSAADLVPYLPTFSTWDPTGTPALKGSVLDAPFKCKPSEDCPPNSSVPVNRRSSTGSEVESIENLRSVLLEAQSRGLLTADTTANDDGITRVFLCDESVLPRVLALARASNPSGQQQFDATRGAHLSAPPASGDDSNPDAAGQRFGEFNGGGRKGDAAPQPLHVVVPFSTVLSATLGASMWHDKDMARDRLAVGSQLRQLLLLCARSHKKTIAAHKHSTRGSTQQSHNNSDHQGMSSQSPESEEGETPEPSRWMQRKIAQEREKDEIRYGRLFSPESVLEASLLHQCTVSFMPFSAEVRLMQEHLGRTAAKAAALEQQSVTINTQIRRLQDQQKVQDTESGSSGNNAKAAAVSPKHIATARTAARYAEIAAAGTVGELSLVWGLPAASSPPPVDTIIKNAASLFGCGSSDHDADATRRDAALDGSSHNAASRLADAALGEDDDSFDSTSTTAEHSGDGEVPAFESPEEAVAAMRRWHEAVLPWILPGLRSHNAVLAAAANGTSSSSSSSSATSASSSAQREDVVELRKVSVGIASASMALHGWCLKRGVPCDRLQGAGQANASNRPVAEAAGRFASRMAQRDRNKEQRAFGPPASS